MTSNRLKNLARIRLILSVIAVLLAGLMIVSGIMHFRPAKPAAEEPAESVPGTIATTVPETTTATETEAPTTETTVSTESTEETTEATQPVDGHVQYQPDQFEAIKRPSSESNSPEEGGNWPTEDTGNNTTGSGNNNSSNSGNDNPSNSGNNGSSNAGNNDSSSSGNNDSSSSGNNDSSSSGNNDSSSSGNNDSSSSGNNDSSSSGNNDSSSSGNNDSSNAGNNNVPDAGNNNVPDTGNNPFEYEEEHHSSDTGVALSEDHSCLYQNVLNTPHYAEEIDPSLSEEPAQTDITMQTEAPVQTENTDQTEVPTQMETSIPAEDPAQTEIPTQPMFAENNSDPVNEENDNKDVWGILFWISAALLSIDLVGILLVSNAIQKELRLLKQTPNKRAHQTVPTTIVPSVHTGPQVASIHQIGRRNYQQDSLGHTSVLGGQGLLAVLADGMGGLTNGEKVSQKIVLDALAIGNDLKPDQVNGCLWKMVDKINENANRMLGADGIYKSGSTLVAVLAYNGRFQWVSVGDSRIYLYRKGYANQLNQDHDQLQVLMADVLSGRLTMEEALRDPNGRKLTSFIGMGQLKYVDGSCHAISLEAGDRLILMSDGIYPIIGEDRLADILKRHPNVSQAASVMERIIRDNNHPKQDNYTAIILGF